MKPLLLAPVHDFISLTAAIEAGADAVYFGTKELNMRITAKNFRLGELKQAVGICHKHNVKAFLTLNTIVYDSELEKARKILCAAKSAGIDAVICWDFAVIEEAKKIRIPIHISTQASVSNIKAALFYERLGAEQVVLARELTLKQVKEIKKKTKLKIEVFAHGAMCVSVSGRCFTSQHIFGRSANRGDCLQPCRREYFIEDAEEGHRLKIGKSYVLSAKDLCTLPFIDKLIKAGISCFKIEGRARSPEYVRTVVSAYRKAIDACLSGKFNKKLKTKLVEKLKTQYNRGFSAGFYFGLPTADDFGAPDTKATTKKQYAGRVINFYKKVGVAVMRVEAAAIKLGDRIMVQGNKTGVKEQAVESMEINGKRLDIAEQGKLVGIKLSFAARANDKVYLVLGVLR